jgi:hypothetical protein
MKTLKDRIHDLRNKGYPQHLAIDYAYANAQDDYYDKRSRIYKRCKAILERPHCKFVLLTISEDWNDIEYHDKIERAAKQWAKKYMTHYIGNRDYGEDESKTERIHWHILGNTRDLRIADSWKYGWIKFKYIYDPNEKRLGRYIIKLTNHALKGSASHIFRSKEK